MVDIVLSQQANCRTVFALIASLGHKVVVVVAKLLEGLVEVAYRDNLAGQQDSGIGDYVPVENDHCTLPTYPCCPRPLLLLL